MDRKYGESVSKECAFLYLQRIMSLSELKMLTRPTQVVTKINLFRLFRLFRFVLTLLQSISWSQVAVIFAIKDFSVRAVTLAR
jgi:hypothetical protein